MLTHEQLRAKAFGRAEVKSQYEEQGDEYALLDEFLKARSTQATRDERRSLLRQRRSLATGCLLFRSRC